MWDPRTRENTPTGGHPQYRSILGNMWTWSLNWGEITPRILIGTCPMTPADLDRIRAGADVSALLSLQHND